MTCPDWTIISWQGFNSLWCPLMLRTNYRWVQSLNISVDVAKCVKIFTNSPSTLTFCLLQQMTCLDRTIYSRQGFNSLGSPLMFRTSYRCVPSLNISEDFAKCVEKFPKFTQYTHYLSVTKNDFSWPKNLFMARFQLIRMSSYVKNKLQMCSGIQHQRRRRPICGKFSQIHHEHSLFVCYKNDFS